MRTEIITTDNPNRYGAALTEAAAALRNGALVIFPTETVYGLAANAANPQALARLREVKGRAQDQPFTVHLPRRAEAGLYLSSPPPLARRLARKAWPGPLTLICTSSRPESERIAQSIPNDQLRELYHNGKVGLRCPSHGAAAELLSKANVPIVASSANKAGKKPPLSLRDALRGLKDKVEFAFDGGPTRFNAPSTIVEIGPKSWKIIRKGAISEPVIRRMAKTEIIMVCTGNTCRSPIAEYLYRDGLAKRLGIPVADLTKQGYLVSSAGTIGFGGGPISPGSRDELAKRGINASGHRSQPLTAELIQRSERIYAMSHEHKATVLDMVPDSVDRVYMLDDKGPVADPIGGGPAEYQSCAAHIERAVNTRLEELLHEDSNW